MDDHRTATRSIETSDDMCRYLHQVKALRLGDNTMQAETAFSSSLTSMRTRLKISEMSMREPLSTAFVLEANASKANLLVIRESLNKGNVYGDQATALRNVLETLAIIESDLYLINPTSKSYVDTLNYIQEALDIASTMMEDPPMSMFYCCATACRVYERLGLEEKAIESAEFVLTCPVLDQQQYGKKPIYPFVGFAIGEALHVYYVYQIKDRDITLAKKLLDKLACVYPLIGRNLKELKNGTYHELCPAAEVMC